jgi:hypothetical protein
LSRYDLITIFGSEYLSLIFDHFKADTFTSRAPSPTLVRFFDSFQQTLLETMSPCWSSSYERPVIPLLEADIESLLAGAPSNNLPTQAAAETTEKKITRRVSKALTNKKQVKRLDTTRPLNSGQSQLPMSSGAHSFSHSSTSMSNGEIFARVWSCVCDRHEQRLQAEIEKTLFKANPKRDEVARLAEQRGFAEFHLIKHDLSKRSTEETDVMYKRLLQLINVFSRALPKMPQTYIARTVLDPRHQSLIIIFASKVIGGICFRMFPHRYVQRNGSFVL